MANNDIIHVCSQCEFSTARWMGFCPQCRTHGSLVAKDAAGSAYAAVPLNQPGAPAHRWPTGMGEVDRVLGGGLVSGSLVLVGGEPGVGKSTLLLQVARAVADTATRPVLYVTGEESSAQISLRGERLGVGTQDVMVLAAGTLEAVSRCVDELGPSMVVIDSVQTMIAKGVDGLAGGVTQVRAVGQQCAEMARGLDIPVVLVGHVTKDGSLAGPKTLEHIVDVTLLIEGDPARGLRYLRGMKNRHGSTDQVGVFEITATGMVEIPDPAGLFCAGWSGDVPGTVLYPAMFGPRTMLVEVQALVAASSTPQPRRSVKGIHAARVHQIAAVLDRHAGISCAAHDVYVNVVGGLSIEDPGADLAVALAMASSRLSVPLGRTAAYGEVGLAGEVRAVGHSERRDSELDRFGVATCANPAQSTDLVSVLARFDLIAPIQANPDDPDRQGPGAMLHSA